MLRNLQTAIHTPLGKVVVSILLGLGLASIFRRVCEDRQCLVFRPPDAKQVEESVYKHDGQCYKYKATGTTCRKGIRRVSFA